MLKLYCQIFNCFRREETMISYQQQGTQWIKGAPQKADNIADKTAARNGTIAYQILNAHREKSDDGIFHIRFDALVSHDIT